MKKNTCTISLYNKISFLISKVVLEALTNHANLWLCKLTKFLQAQNCIILSIVLDLETLL